MDSRRLFFHHLPKTAGTSFRSVLLEVYGESRVSPKIPGWRVAEAVRTYRDCAAISGHMRAMPGDVPPAEYYTATVLREPLDRFLSEFYFSKHDFRVSRADLSDMKRLELHEFIEQTPGDSGYAWNLQVETLYPYCCNKLGNVSPADKLKAAKEALDLFDCVGVQEEFSDFVQVVSYDMGWPPLQGIPRENMTTRRVLPKELPEAIRCELTERTALDSQLYEYALELFRRKRRRVLVACVASRTCEQAPSALHPADASTVASAVSRAGIDAAVQAPIEFGDHRLEIASVTLTGALHEPRAVLSGEVATISVRICAHETIENFTAGFAIRDSERRLVYGTNTRFLGYSLAMPQGSEQVLTFSFRTDLPLGKYTVDVSLHRGSSHLAGCFHWLESAAAFEIVGNIGDHYEGRVKLYPWVANMPGPDGALMLSRETEPETRFLQQLDRPNPPLQDFQAIIRPVAKLPTTFRAGDELAVELEVQNTGAATWRATGIRPVRIGFHWFDVDGNSLDYEGIRTTLTHDVRPGEKALHWCVLRVPEYGGPAILIWSLVQEEVAWFDDRNSGSAFRLECEVAK